MWKSSSPWPTLRGALYDNNLRQNGGYWGVHAALRDRIHVQMDVMNPAFPLSQTEVKIVNKIHFDESGLSVSAVVYSAEGILLRESRAENITSLANTVTPVNLSLVETSDEFSTLFTFLHLKSAAGVILSKNFYWSSNAGLVKLRESRAVLDATAKILEPGPSQALTQIEVHMQSVVRDNPIAFFVSLQLIRSESGSTHTNTSWKRILPVFYSENYITVAPGEKLIVLLETKLACFGIMRMFCTDKRMECRQDFCPCSIERELYV